MLLEHSIDYGVCAARAPDPNRDLFSRCPPVTGRAWTPYGLLSSSHISSGVALPIAGAAMRFQCCLPWRETTQGSGADALT